jgi:hypothetical protein
MSDTLARIDLRTHSEDLSPGLAARVHDPAWLLARQWAFGEFQGENGGSPVIANLSAELHPLSAVSLNGQAPVESDPETAPLNALVEAAPVRHTTGWTARMRISAGREFIRQLAGRDLAGMVPRVVAAYPIERLGPAEAFRDAAGARLIAVAAGRIPDGEQLHAEAGGAVLSRVPTPPGREQNLAEALEGWSRWLGSTRNEPPLPSSAWVPERLEHRFGLQSANLDVEFRADSHRGGSLDWPSFEAVQGPAPTGSTSPLEVLALPTPVRFRGMPVPRLFELEDESVDLGAADAAPSDLARMALLEYAFTFGNDVSSIPLRLPLGTFTRVLELRVTDTFGTEVVLAPALREPSSPGGSDGFALYVTTTAEGRRLDGLLLPHTAAHGIVGPPVEEVRLLRDEMANLVWAIEARIEGGDGSAFARVEEDARAAPPPTSGAGLAYRLQTRVPSSWLPLVLQPPEDQAGRRMLRLETLAPSTEPPRGKILPPVGGLVHEEEVPREGVRLLREAVLCRWVDGSTHLWTRRRRATGRGEGSSGLRFDVAEPVAGGAS